MDRCKEGAIALIDRALECRSRLDFCSCNVMADQVLECDGCRIKRALRVARSCIVLKNDALDLLQARFIGVQEAFGDKLKAVLRPGGNGGENEG